MLIQKTGICLRQTPVLEDISPLKKIVSYVVIPI